ncbi:serine hydrolase domain-containing protein [Nonomuraea sp. NPDC001684]
MADTHGSIIRLLETGVREQVYPGAVWAIGDADTVLDSGAHGAMAPGQAAMRLDTVFDVASLTKILAVWAVIGTLWHDQQLSLDDPVATFWPEVAGYPLGQVTARQLLTHTAGVPLRANLRAYGTDPQVIREGVLHEELHRPPGQAVEYTGGRCAPTEFDPDTEAHLQGVAHDYSARLLGGVCGIAGVFSVVQDLAAFLRDLLHPGPDPAHVGFGPTWVAESLRINTGALTPARGLFWHPAPGTSPQDDVHVHYGFTGTAMWVSPGLNRWAVLLTNKLYFTRDRDPLMAIRDTFRQHVFG